LYGRGAPTVLALRYLARGFSLFICLFIAAIGFSQSFGRFGYGECHAVPGWSLLPEGFRANIGSADTFTFPAKAVEWKALETSAQSQTVSLGDQPPGGPTQLRMDLAAPGFSLYFPKGIDLRLGTTGAPYLSWPDGTVAESVPTPPQPWIVVSFTQEEPPVLLAFADGPHPMVVEGSPGDWHLRSKDDFTGWVRFTLPVGLKPMAPATAAAFGDLAQHVIADGAAYVGDAPKLVDTKYESDSTSVTVTWSFDKPGALVPSAALLAGFGGYPLQITTQIERLETTTEEGPLAITREKDLCIRFLTAQWPIGRYFSCGALVFGADSIDSVANAIDVGCKILSASAPSEFSSRAGAGLMKFLSSSRGDLEPNTNQRMPYKANGDGYDLTTAFAFMTQAMSFSNGTTSLANPLLEEVWARVDPYTWMPFGIEESISRRSAALAAITFSMRSDPSQRAEGAMLQAGLSAQRGLDLWHYWRGDMTVLPKRLEVMEGLRQKFFGLKGAPIADPFVSNVFSPVRLLTPGTLSVTPDEGAYEMSWLALNADQGSMTLSANLSLDIAATQNLKSAKVDHQGVLYTISYTPRDVGICVLSLKMGDSILPNATAVSYSEVSR